MTESNKNIGNLDIKSRKMELQNINILQDEFGDVAYRGVERQHVSIGYNVGMERLTRLLKEKKFSKEKFMESPTESIREFLYGFFKERGGNLPAVWVEDKTVYLITEFGEKCVTIEAEKQIKVCHKDICNLYCRAFVKGMVQIFEDLFPGIMINFYNQSSRRVENNDCIEAFQIVIP